jgi:hypothetical protein
MKNLFPLFLFLMFFGMSTSSFACSCGGPFTFCETVAPQLDQLLIIRGIKTKQVEHGMDFEIKGIFNGNESKETIRIWGDPGHLCRLYTAHFEIGEEVILALHKIDYEPSESFCCESEEKGDYIISVCGVYFVRTSDESGMAAAEACLGEELKKCDIQNLHFYPNPTQSLVTLNSPIDLKDQEGSLQLLNLRGQIVFEYSTLEDIYTNGKITMNLAGLARGVYVFRLELPIICPDPSIGRIVVN